MDKLFKNTQKSFILMEMLVAIAMFMIVIVAITNLSVSAIRSQKLILTSQELFNQSSYALEYIGRALRMAQRDSSGSCISANSNYENPSGGSSIRFLNHNGKCQEFYLEAGKLKEGKSTTAAATFANPADLTSNHLKINSIDFHLSGQGWGDDLQPRVTIMLNIETRKIVDPPQFKIQTSISQRNLDL